ncbi:MAG TPA: hypothetical protein VK738_13405 [Terriglobales bacterium]|jgi:hypothetical protein|nr:hypothetical protein [Terriglobales bacterium]
MKKLALILFVASAISAFAADNVVKGYLLDSSCAGELQKHARSGAGHTKGCLQMPDCVKSGYGVLTDDLKFIKFDKAGNEQASKFIDGLTKNKDIKVTVSGEVIGDTMTVSKIELQ